MSSKSKKNSNRRVFKPRVPTNKPAKKGKKITSLKSKLNEIYGLHDLRTTCPGHCVCCQVACPQMNHSEFLVIVDSLYRREAKVDRAEVLKASVRYFFSNSLIKPCPLLVNGRCSVYEERPLACRLYGQWPDDMYDDRVKGFIKSTGLKKEEIPLNTQCQFVKPVDKDRVPISRKDIEEMFKAIDTLDMNVGGFDEKQIGKRYNQRTWHDWFMVTVFGEERLSALTTFFLAAEEEAVEDLVVQICKQIDDVGENIFGNVEKEVGDGRTVPHSYR